MAFMMMQRMFAKLLILFILASLASSGQTSPRKCWPERQRIPATIPKKDIDLLQFAMNLEFLEAEFFLFGALGKGLDDMAPQLVKGGPPPIGPMKANLDRRTRKIIEEFAYQEIGHLRAIQRTVGAFPRPLLDLSLNCFSKMLDETLGYYLSPPLNPYQNSINYMLASYLIPYMGLVGYVGANPNLKGFITKRLLAGLLGVESGQDAVIRSWLYARSEQIVEPYNITVGVLTNVISTLRNRLAGCGIKDEGIIVPQSLGAENRTYSNVLSADANSLSYARTPAEILRVVYGTGDEHRPAGFFPDGCNGRIAREYLED